MKLLRAFPFAALLCCILFLSAWGAGVFPSSVCATTIVMCAAGALTLISAKRRTPLVALVAVGTILLLILSAVPLPGRLDALTGRRRKAQNDLVLRTLSEARENRLIAPDTDMNFSHTRNRAGTIRIVFLSLLMLCAATVAAAFSRRTRRAYLHFLTVLLTVISVLGFLHQWIWPADKTIWWIFNFPHGSPVGGFVSRTHHAGFIALICPVCLALLVQAINTRRPISAILHGTAFALMIAAILSSLSRGAILAAAAGIIAVVAIAAHRRHWLACLCVCTLVLSLTVASLAILCATRDNAVSRSIVARLHTLAHPTQTFSGRARLSVWRDSLKVWRDYPVTGVGANGFRMVFPLYRMRSDRQTFVTPENEYVELLVDGGLLGVLLASSLAALLLARWHHGVKEELLPPELSLAIAGALVVAAVHNGVDVPMHTPLYAMTFASLLGMAFPSPDTAEKQPFLVGFAVPPRLWSAAALTAAFATGAFFLFAGVEPYRADLQDSVVSGNADQLSRGLVRAPTSWATWYHLGRCAFRARNRAAYRFGERCVTRATEYDPKNYRLWEALGHIRLSMGYQDGAREAFERMHALRSWKKPPRIQSR